MHLSDLIRHQANFAGVTRKLISKAHVQAETNKHDLTHSPMLQICRELDILVCTVTFVCSVALNVSQILQISDTTVLSCCFTCTADRFYLVRRTVTWLEAAARDCLAFARFILASSGEGVWGRDRILARHRRAAPRSLCAPHCVTDR